MDIKFNSYTPDWSWLSNFSPHPVKDFPTVEHAYQAAKFTDSRVWETIKQAKTPAQAKAMGRELIGVRKNWAAIKESVMLKALRIKFQDPELKDLLIHTYPHQLIHYAPWGDIYWGVDKSGQGQNRQGILLMEVRAELLHEEPYGN